jgi:hypothetical protein
MSCNNCGTCFKICQPFQACFSEMKVSEPVGQSVDIFIVSISNGQEVNFRQQIEAVDGLLEIDLTLFPDGFFSAYGGPYTLQFFDVESKELINFVATNGNSYNCIEFEFQNGSEVDSITISA